MGNSATIEVTANNYHNATDTITIGVTANPVTISLQPKSSISAGNPWLASGRCGSQHLLPNGQPGQCDPNGRANQVGPCCSSIGWCGNSAAHCDCPECIDYRETAEI